MCHVGAHSHAPRRGLSSAGERQAREHLSGQHLAGRQPQRVGDDMLRAGVGGFGVHVDDDMGHAVISVSLACAMCGVKPLWKVQSPTRSGSVTRGS